MTREELADLRPGDLIELHHTSWPGGSTVKGPIYARPGGGLYCCGFAIRFDDGDSLDGFGTVWAVDLISRPLYVNHGRHEPMTGDVVRNADDDADLRTWRLDHEGDWLLPNTAVEHRDDMPARLLLLVDGTTGQAVPS